MHGCKLSDGFKVKTGAKQGCLLSPFLFLLAIDWIIKTTTDGHNNGIQWTLWQQLDDLNFADDIALISHTNSQMQEKTDIMTQTAQNTGRKVNKRKTKVMNVNSSSDQRITVKGNDIEEVESFSYLGSVVSISGGIDADVAARINKARTAFYSLKKIWSSRQITTSTKIQIFNTNVKSVLLYGAETCRITSNVKENSDIHQLLSMEDLKDSLARQSK